MRPEPVRLHRYTYRQYLALEETSSVKHEFLDGEIYAMAGGTPEHAALSAEIIASLASQTRGGACRVYSSDLRVRVLASGLTTYPDATVVCGPTQRDPESPATVVNPRVVVEVLSDGTEEYDRGEKLGHYKRIPELDAVVLVAHRERLIVVHWRSGSGWESRSYRAGESALIECIACEIDVDDLYDAAAEPAG